MGNGWWPRNIRSHETSLNKDFTSAETALSRRRNLARRETSMRRRKPIGRPMIGPTPRETWFMGSFMHIALYSLGLTYFYLAHERLLVLLVSADASRFLKSPLS